MTPETQDIIERALSLPPADKARIVDELLSSLSQPDQIIVAEWRKEVEDRVKAYNDGALKTVSLDAAFEKYRK